jgi:D-amino-acid oxidase
MSWSRRQLLIGGASALASPAWAQQPRVLGGDVRADPDFALPGKQLVGVRPHRVGGVRVELEAVSAAGVTKQVVHNYGHGAAGITLSWGTAARAIECVEEAMTRVPEGGAVAVIGTGIVGLTTAWELRRRWPELAITLYAKDLDVRTTTSWVAGGQFEPSGIWREYQGSDARREWFADVLRASRDRVLSLAGDWARLGIAERDHFTLDHDQAALEVHTPKDVLAPYERGVLPFRALNFVGRRYRTWLLNPTLMLPALKAELATTGVRFEARTFGSVADVAALPEPIVVNCTGYGAKTLWADEKMVALRGHVLSLPRTERLQDWFFGGGCENGVVAYVFCRQNDIIVGGTVGVNEESPTLLPEDQVVFDRVLQNGRELFAGRPSACLRY